MKKGDPVSPFEGEVVAEEEDEDKEPLSWIDWAYIFGVESLSCADIVTDLLILLQLIDGGHLWWTTCTIIFIASPYLVTSWKL